MKKIISRLLAFLLVLSTLLLSSCGVYTYHGFADNNSKGSYCWSESYKTFSDRVETLHAYGSSFYKDIPINYDGDLFDVKYCIALTSSKWVDKPEDAIIVNNSFKRNYRDVGIFCFAFFEDVSLREVRKSPAVGNFKSYRIIVGTEYADNHDCSYDGLTVDMLECVEIPFLDGYIYEYRHKDSGELVLCIEPTRDKWEKLSDEVIQEIINSIDVEMYKKIKDSMVDGEFLPYGPGGLPMRCYYW